MNPEPFTDDDWLTPPELIEALGPFDLDPCMPRQRPWDTAAKHFTLDDNGLIQPWTGRVWLNPPYSKINGKSQLELWLKKMVRHGNGIALTNARTETQWFFESVWGQATALFFPKGRLRFFRPDGRLGDTGKSASVIAAYSHADAQILYRLTAERSPCKGQFVPLVVTFTADIRTSWRKLIRWLLRECGGSATLDQIYALAQGHPKTLQNSNWKAKLRQQVQKEAVRAGPALWRMKFQPSLAL